MKLPAPPTRKDSDDHLIPLINIVFLLLIFFMLAGALSRPEPFSVEPPYSDEGQAATVDEWVLSVAADGRFALDGEELLRDAVIDRIEQRTRNGDDLRIKLRADADLNAELLLPLFDDLRDAGVERLTLLTVASGG
ncbi:hypothetical protein CAI21_20795 [Alkalilimnicola ehrlichii]|uniref:Outer membrane transport energization protein ExbD n=1 Tax=Alkalilimnicola ehrlichii TaxID=351052 RepID=A0A3E0WP52_9GAMM|nr:biopolymer transporter ExbD [Alkalilimnicola ehrlichii]RFA24656.1 hypothetical protein CAI21_20795 [Alkalilimnicola ehrlichii]RFA33766.1 hypothetical protein CAL65_16625 [Alkalilimnicola ehrlichii]